MNFNRHIFLIIKSFLVKTPQTKLSKFFDISDTLLLEKNQIYLLISLDSIRLMTSFR